MAKVKVRKSYDDANTIFRAVIRPDSLMEIDIGEAYDMSRREITIIETSETDLLREIAKVRSMIASLEADRSAPVAALRAAAGTVADKASQMVTDRKWYSISAKGVLEAAKAVGDAGVPLFSACAKVIELLGNAKV